MKTDGLFKTLDSYYPLGDDFKEALTDVITHRHLPRGQLLLQPGRTPAHAWYICRGAARGLAYDEVREEEVTTWFWLEEEVMVALDSFCRQVPSGFSIELLADSELFSISYRALDQLAMQIPSYRLLERHIVETYLLRIYRHYYERSSLPAQARYEKLMAERPQLFQIAPIKHIASFLGVFPDTLSRLRSGK